MGITDGVSGISIGGCIVLVISFVLHLVGFATPYWYYFSAENVKAYFGLWRLCSGQDSMIICLSTADNPATDEGWYHATQAFACLGFIALLVASVLASLGTFILKDKKMLGLGGAVTALIGAVFVFLAVVIFGAKVNAAYTDGHEYLHASFGLCIVAFILAIIAGVMLLVDNLKK